MNDPILLGLLFLIISIPVSFAINLATPRFERWWASRSERKAAELAARDEALRRRAAAYVGRPEALVAVLWSRLLVTIRLLVLVGLAATFTAFVLAAANFLDAFGLLDIFSSEGGRERLQNFLAVALLLGAMVAFMLLRFAFSVVGDAITLMRIVRSLEAEAQRKTHVEKKGPR